MGVLVTRGTGALGREVVKVLRTMAARGSKKRLVNLWIPLRFSRQFARGKLLSPDRKDGTITFEQYLEQRYMKEP